MRRVNVPFPLVIFVIALVIRLVPVLLARDLGIGLDDMFQYDMLGRSIAGGNGFRWYALSDLDLIRRYVSIDLSTIDYDPRGVLTSFRAPAYPTFLAAVYVVSGLGFERFLAARLAQAVLSAALVPITYFVARRLFPTRPRVAQWSAMALAVYPILVLYPIALVTENLFFLLALASVLALLKTAESPKLGWFALAGALIGLAALTRSVFLAVGVAAALWAWFALKRWQGALVIAAAMLLICAPWMARNSILHGSLTGIETSAGYNLYLGYHPESTGTFQYGPSLDLLPVLDDVRRDRLGKARAFDFMRADPARVPALALARLGHFFGLEKRALMYFYAGDYFGHIATPLLATLALLFVLPFAIVSASALFGLALADWRRPEIQLIGVVLLAYLVPHVLILAEDRFHLAVLPLLIVFAARFWDGGLAETRAAFAHPGAGRVLAVLACVGVALLALNWGYELYRDADKLALIFGPNGNDAALPY
ncbi:MAG: glycosyltransferase family 39 protein [Coriobacteriales bacterium]|nr:glycosyltransferase family 39 protein [Coriobacteriales bacterium]